MLVLEHFYSRNKLIIENSTVKFHHVAYSDQVFFQGNVALDLLTNWYGAHATDLYVPQCILCRALLFAILYRSMTLTFIEILPKVKYFGKVHVHCHLLVVTCYQIFSYYVKIIGSVTKLDNSYFIKLQDFQSCWDHTKTCCWQVHIQSILTANCHRNQLVSTATVSWDTVYQTWP